MARIKKIYQQDELNCMDKQFRDKHPKDILKWCVDVEGDKFIQVSAFSIEDLIITDILYNDFHAGDRLGTPVLFINTLHHFKDTLDTVTANYKKYGLALKVYRPKHCKKRVDFNEKYGDKLWERDLERYHQVTKIEPLYRGMDEVITYSWLTGRRRSQSESRKDMQIFEWTSKERLKINPLAYWTKEQVWEEAKKRDILYNPMYDRGYMSIGDAPLTTPVEDGEDERDGRWRGSKVSECGMHE